MEMELDEYLEYIKSLLEQAEEDGFTLDQDGTEE
jgi:hypothetical protein